MNKRILILILVLAVFAGLTLTGCSEGTGKADGGKLICGVTPFEPMNFLDASGNWTGFDTDLALAVGEKLGMTVEFQEIEWGNKYNELESGAINAIWNGFTANAEEEGVPRTQKVDFSFSYMSNQQSVVIKTDKADEFKTAADLEGKTAAAEAGSAGESATEKLVGESGSVIGTPAQVNAFTEVKSGAVDFAVVDVLLAQRTAGSGDYEDLIIADIVLEGEVYAVGFKKGSDLTEKVNGALQKLYDDGTMLKIAQKYGLEDELIFDNTFKS